MSADTSEAMVLTETAERIRIEAPAYTLEIADRDERFAETPVAVLRGADGREWSTLSLLSSVHTVAAADETLEVAPPEARREPGGAVRLVVRTRSAAWAERRIELRCTPDAIEVVLHARTHPDAPARLTEVTVLGGAASLPSGANGMFRSSIGFASVFVPTPTEPVAFSRPARAAAVLGVVGDADAGRLNAIFTPPPLVFGLGRTAPGGAAAAPRGQHLGVGLRAPVDELRFPALHYRPLDAGWSLAFDYEGHTRVDGDWSSPVIVLRPADDGWRVLDDHRADLDAHGLVPGAPAPAAEWWTEPLFCGWGAQCARAARAVHEAALAGEETAVLAAAPAFARQSVYDDFLARLTEHDLVPGTIVIDDRWQREYGLGTVDEEHWPDLAGWIADRHAAGQKVLLWWKAWDPEGVPPEECVTDAAGRAVCVDPANPDYCARLTGILHHLLSPDGLNADGLKVDFTQRGPSGQSLRAHDGAWGMASLHLLLATIHRAAHAAKGDALVITHAMHPSFGDVSDMVRLNDVLALDAAGDRVPVAEQLRMRHAIVSRALPGRPIDTDQWPMPDRAQWLEYVRAQETLGVPALYYLETMDRSDEAIGAADLAEVRAGWARYRAGRRR